MALLCAPMMTVNAMLFVVDVIRSKNFSYCYSYYYFSVKDNFLYGPRSFSTSLYQLSVLYCVYIYTYEYVYNLLRKIVCVYVGYGTQRVPMRRVRRFSFMRPKVLTHRKENAHVLWLWLWWLGCGSGNCGNSSNMKHRSS